MSHFSEHARPFLERVSSRASYPLLEEYMVLVAKVLAAIVVLHMFLITVGRPQTM